MDGLDEVNFWQPSGQQQFRALQIGEPFLFKLHSPDDCIVGGGFFSHFTILPASIVWQAFGEKNGARTEEEMRTRIVRYRRTSNPGAAADYQIGCILLESPFFFDRADWIPVQDWKREVVRGRGYGRTTTSLRRTCGSVPAPRSRVISPHCDGFIREAMCFH